MNMKKLLLIGCIVILGTLSACMGPAGGASAGGELTGVSAVAWNEPAPYGMVLVKRGSLKIGPEKSDSLWGISVPTKEVSVDAFWMDETEITNSKYKQFVFWVRDSIIRERWLIRLLVEMSYTR